MHSILTKLLAIIITAFALITLYMSASIIFDWFGIREKEGNYVMFIVVGNFVAGFMYLISVYALLKQSSQTTQLLLATFLMLILCLFGLLYHIYEGGMYEQKTVYAMIFRITLTGAFTIGSYFLLSNKK